MGPPRTPSLIADALLALWRSRAKPGCAERAGADAHHKRRAFAPPPGRAELTEVRIVPLTGIPEVAEGDDLAGLLGDAVERAGGLQGGDVVVDCTEGRVEGRGQGGARARAAACGGGAGGDRPGSPPPRRLHRCGDTSRLRLCERGRRPLQHARRRLGRAAARRPGCVGPGPARGARPPLRRRARGDRHGLVRPGVAPGNDRCCDRRGRHGAAARPPWPTGRARPGAAGNRDRRRRRAGGRRRARHGQGAQACRRR